MVTAGVGMPTPSAATNPASDRYPYRSSKGARWASAPGRGWFMCRSPPVRMPARAPVSCTRGHRRQSPGGDARSGQVLRVTAEPERRDVQLDRGARAVAAHVEDLTGVDAGPAAPAVVLLAGEPPRRRAGD